MPNDDLGQFPMPANPATPIEPTNPPTQPDTTSMLPPDNLLTPTETPTAPIESTIPQTPPAFEETPEEVPAYNPPASLNDFSIPETPSNEPPATEPTQYQTPIVETTPVAEPTPVVESAPMPTPIPVAPPEIASPQPIPATGTPHGSNAGPLLFVALLLIAIVALAGAAFLYQQSQTLKTQLNDLSKTLQKQQINPTETLSPTIEQIPETSITPTSTLSATITPTKTVLSPTPSSAVVYVAGNPLKPLAVASNILQIAINHSPNAQFILMKTENANDPVNATTKYFFRQDLTTKQYFYILVSANAQPEIVDKQIFVTPDNNIPSLNDLVLQNTLGMDLDEAITLVNSSCIDKTACSSATAKAQYIKTTTAVIWQISLTVPGKTQPMVMQINAQTKAILFKTTDFAQ